MAEYKTHGFIVRPRGENEIHITQAHLEDNDESGVIITLKEVELLIRTLERIRKEFPDVSSQN